MTNDQLAMNSNLMNSQSAELQQAMPEQATASVKLIVFTIGNLNLALPIESVYKILNRTPVYGSGTKQVGVSHIGDREITVIDLYRRFFKSSQPEELNQRGYLVTVQSKTGEVYGIPVADTPVLMDVAVSAIRILPESYRNADTVDIARHVAVIPKDETSLTIFLLDIELLLPKG